MTSSMASPSTATQGDQPTPTTTTNDLTARLASYEQQKSASDYSWRQRKDKEMEAIDAARNYVINEYTKYTTVSAHAGNNVGGERQLAQQQRVSETQAAYKQLRGCVTQALAGAGVATSLTFLGIRRLSGRDPRFTRRLLAPMVSSGINGYIAFYLLTQRCSKQLLEGNTQLAADARAVARRVAPFYDAVQEPRLQSAISQQSQSQQPTS